MAEPEIATRAEILGWLSEAARRGHVPAMRLLLEELRHDEAGHASSSSVFDEMERIRARRMTPSVG
jgi:hypothetical protein